MPGKDASTPRVFLVRHGETAWTLSGRFTGRSEISLTPHGTTQVQRTAALLFGPGKLVDPERIVKMWVSPRVRARVTAGLLFKDRETGRKGEEEGKVGEGKKEEEEVGVGGKGLGKVGEGLGEEWAVTEELAEWDYGLYEGLLTAEIRRGRKERVLDADRAWDIWKDGSPEQVTARLDGLIAKVRGLQRGRMNGEEKADVVLVAHGHILRAFAKRWLEYPLEFPLSMMLEPGGVGILSYQHHNIEEPAFLLGMGIP
ncbi:hypothetical protein MMC30_001628 [Trapelia coarctata]|nr:hypothetical protein [Trapelia coarctata]